MKNKVPKLRFPEFSGEWEEKKIGNTGKIVGGGTPSTKEEYYWKGNIPWISSSDLSEEKINKIKITRFISEEAILNSATKLIPKNSILIVSRVGVGKVAVSDIDLCTSQDFANLTPSINYNSSFLANLIKIKTDYLLEFNQGTSIKGFVKSDLENLNILIPSLPEQEKIANFLSSVDIKIEKLEKKKELLEKYKKGMMQKLFSQKLRFKDENGNDYPEWEEKRLGEIAKFSKGKNITKADISEEGFECIRYGELYTKYNEIIKEVTSKTNLKETDLIFSEVGDIIIPASGETAIDLATASCVLKNGIALGGDINIIKTKENGIFLSYYMNNSKKYEIASLAQGISVIHIYNSQLGLLKLSLPSLSEQEKIANFLSSIDRKIELIEEELEKNKEFKKGLLQQMFV